MKLCMFWTIASLWFFTIGQQAFALSVVSIKCVNQSSEADCTINLSGLVSVDDTLLLTDVFDIDITKYKDQEIGRTGFLFGKKYYAAFLPRIYSLKSLAGLESPTLTMHCWSVLGTGVGIQEESSTHRIISQKQSLQTFMLLLSYRLLALLFIVGVGVYSFRAVRSKVLDGWTWESHPLLVLYGGTIIFCLSMIKVLRMLVPAFVTQGEFYAIHGISEAWAIWGLTELIRTASFIDQTAIVALPVRNGRVLRFMASVTFGGAVIASIMIISSVIASHQFQLKQWHAWSVLIQASIALVILFARISAIDLRRTIRRALFPAVLFLVAQVLAVLVLIRDAVVYVWFHNPGTEYYIQYCLLSILIVGAYRWYTFKNCEEKGKIFSERFRIELRDLKSGEQRLNRLCQLVQQTWEEIACATVTSIRDWQVMVFGSAGPQALPLDRKPAPLRLMLKLLCDRKHSIYVPSRSELGEVAQKFGYENACFAIPIVQEGAVIAAITVMAHPGMRFSPHRAQLLQACASALELEVLSALGQTVAEDQLEIIRQIASSTSGIVLETANAWGQIRASIPPSRRLILSADGVKTTYLDQIGCESHRLLSLSKIYKQEIYAGWMAIQKVFELVSKDVRGDDFWVLSPAKFKNQKLASLGRERVILMAAQLVEEHSRLVSARHEFRLLARAGSHVAVSADEVELIPLGIKDSMCHDIHGDGMSRLHRIRGEADPGGVLVDLQDTELCNS